MEYATAARQRIQLRRTHWPMVRARDLILPCAVAVIQVAAAYGTSDHQQPAHALAATDVLLLLIGPVALLGRRRYPVAVLWITFLAALGPHADWLASISFVVSFFSATAAGHRRAGWAVLATGFVGWLWLAPLVRGDQLASLRDVLLLGGWLAVLGIVAETVRIRRERSLASSAARVATDRERASAQRLLIARELHDVVGHNISLINLQAGVGLDLIDTQPHEAREALAAIRTVSKEALEELRAMLASLRATDLPPTAPRAPSPDLSQLPGLIALARAAGLSVTTETIGTPRALGAAVELAAYRIVQESLTNVVRHAPGSDTSIRLSYAPDSLDLQVRDSGGASGEVDAAASRDGEAPIGRPGSGIAGMRERAVALGGHLEARHDPGGGFEVLAHLPTDGSP